MFVSSSATILHADLDAFYASVEQRDNPRLRGKPVIVGGGVVLAASYEAKARGVKTAMGGWRALQLCPDAIVVPPRMQAYTQASRDVFEVFDDTSPQVEALSIDEAFLDARGMERIAGTPEQIARKLRRDVRERVGLPITVGVARTKFLAKVASAQAKPDGLLVVPPDGELAFLHPLPIEALWGVGPATGARLRRVGIETVGEVAKLDEDSLVRLLGHGAGRKLHALAHNRDPRPVVIGRRRRSMGTQRALGKRQRSWVELDSILVALVDRLTRRLRKAERVARTATLRMRHLDWQRSTRSHTLPEATASTVTLLEALRELLADARPADRAPRPDAARDRAEQPRRRPRRPARAAARGAQRERARRRARRRPRALRGGLDQARGPARPRRGAAGSAASRLRTEPDLNGA